MKTASLNELKKELENLESKELRVLCLHLAKYKKENKELITYLLFEAHDNSFYIESTKQIIDSLYEEINKSNLYYARKSLRKILRVTNKYIKYTGSKQVEVELLIYYCQKLRESGIAFQKSTALANLYTRQVQKIKKALATLHVDLQFDYENDVKLLNN
jgi:hypothetical protein